MKECHNRPVSVARGMDLGERKSPTVRPIDERLLNVESLSDARTPLADFFSILLGSRFDECAIA